MSWNNHINKIIEKAGKRLSAMIRIAGKLDKQTKLNIYLSFIRPILEYGCMIFDNTTQEMVHLLESIQRLAAIKFTSAYKCTKHENFFTRDWLEYLEQKKNLFKTSAIL